MQTLHPYTCLLDLPAESIEPMDKKTTAMLTSLLIQEARGWEPAPDLVEMIESTFENKVFVKRVEGHLGMKVDQVMSPAVRFFILSLKHTNNPARLVMWAFTIVTLAARERKRITLTELCYAFSNGFPTKEAMQKAWADQKVPFDERHRPLSDNLLDRHDTWLGAVETIKASIG